MPTTAHARCLACFRCLLPALGAIVLLCFAPGLPAAAEPEPLLLYYSRTGTTKTVAGAISAALACTSVEIRSHKPRHGLHTVTCVLDQLLDRNDDPEPLARPLPAGSDLIIATPIWLHRPASPMRTFLQRHNLAGRTVYLVLTHQGNFSRRDIAAAEALLLSCGLRPAATYAICTRGLTPPGVHRRARLVARKLRRALQPD